MQILTLLKKLLLSTILIITFQNLQAQDKIVKYYDSTWIVTTKNEAYFYTVFVKQDSVYNGESFYKASNNKYSEFSSYDTTFTSFKGRLVRYSETGIIQDSSFYYDDGVKQYHYHYYPNGKLRASYIYNPKTKKDVQKGYDEKGKTIADFKFIKEAEFPGGIENWQKFLISNIKTKIPIKRGAGKGSYIVIVRFKIGKDGVIFNIEPETNFGFGMEEEVMRVIKKSPKWSPEISLNQIEIAEKRQPVTFEITEY